MKRDWDPEALLEEVVRTGRGGHFELHIDKEGAWYYRGSRIERQAIVRLFASILRRAEDGGYWLVTPVEQGRITVEDVPFTITDLERRTEGCTDVLAFKTNLGVWIEAGMEHPLTMRESPSAAGPVPYLLVRNRLEGRLLRPLYYELVEIAVPHPEDEALLCVSSHGTLFALGRLEEPAPTRLDGSSKA